MKVNCFIIILSFLSLLVNGQDKVLKVTLEGIVPYDTLSCRISLEDRTTLTYQGTYQSSTNSWFCHIPDTILEQAKYVRLVANRKDTPEIKNIYPDFKVISDKDTTLRMEAFPFYERTDTLRLCATFVSDTVRNSIYYGRENTVIEQSFVLVDPSPELQCAIVNNSVLYTRYKKLERNKFYDIFNRMFAQSPGSHSNMLLLYSKRDWFSLEQLLQLNDLFTEEQKRSHYDRKLREYITILTDKFADTSLANCATKEKETIVADESKYTLLVFSASWCVPCHELIPLLKEFYEKKKEVLDIVYVTLDDPDKLPAWNNLVEKQAIPWRTLTVDGKVNEIRDKYKVRVIPYMYLIYPHRGKADRIEIRNEEGKLKIMNLNLD